jgi:oligopeptide transport system substrate-binding protein
MGQGVNEAMTRWALPMLVLALLAACGRDDTPLGDTSSGGEIAFRRGNGGEPATLDPQRNEEESGSNVIRDLYEGLVSETVDAKLTPGVAESWDVSPNGLTYTFHLRDNAHWSNGDPVTAEDFVAGMRRTVDPATTSTYAAMLFPIQNAEQIVSGEKPPGDLGVHALDANTLEIVLRAPTPYFLHLLTHTSTFPIHRPSLAQYGSNFALPGRLVSNGAYRLAEWVVESHIRLERNDYYWDREHTQIDVVYYYPTEDIDSELKRYRAGELDYTFQIPVSQYRWIQENLPGELKVSPYLSVYFYGFDLTEPPFDDVRLRQALTMAIDRRIITERVTGVGERPAFGLIPPGIADYSQQHYEWEAWSDERRVARARELYAAAGYSAERPLKTEIRYNTSENHKRIAAAVASMWKETLGVEATLFNEEWKVMLQTRRDPTRWQIMRYGWIGDYNDPYTFLEIFESGNGQNFTGFHDAEYDRLTAAAAVEGNLQNRRELMQHAEQRLLEQYPILPVYFYVNKHLVKPYVKGYEPNVMNHDYSRHYRIERN